MTYVLAFVLFVAVVKVLIDGYRAFVDAFRGPDSVNERKPRPQQDRSKNFPSREDRKQRIHVDTGEREVETSGHPILRNIVIAQDIQSAIVRDFCRTNGAPTADWLRRLSAEGQREVIGRWIVKTRDPEFTRRIRELLMPQIYAAFNKSYDDYMRDPNLTSGDKDVPFTPCLTAENIEEEIRYGCLEESDFPSVIEYWDYQRRCDNEWRRFVEGRMTVETRDKIIKCTLWLSFVCSVAYDLPHHPSVGHVLWAAVLLIGLCWISVRENIRKNVALYFAHPLFASCAALLTASAVWSMGPLAVIGTFIVTLLAAAKAADVRDLTLAAAEIRKARGFHDLRKSEK